MKIYFKTKRDRNGNTYYLFINTENKTFTTENPSIFAPDDAITIGNKDRHKLVTKCQNHGYTRVDAIDWKNN